MTTSPDSSLTSTQLISRYKTVAAQKDEIFRLLIESVKEYAIFVLDSQGYVLTWNPGAQAIKGYTPSEIIGQHFSKFYLPEAIERGWPSRELALAEKEGRFSDEGWRVKKDGSVFWASVIITPLWDSDRRLYGFAKVTRDMSERRKWDEQTQKLNRELRSRVAQLDEAQRLIELRTIELQRLSARLLSIQDEERRRLARELHDELGQQLSALGMMIGADANNKEARDTLQIAVQTVRNISYLLHPPLLDEVGLRPALEWYIEGLTKRSGIQISLGILPQNFPRLPKDLETAIFRIVQESLTNVYRHSGSNRASIEIVLRDKFILVRIRDYGQGVPMEIIGKRSTLDMGVGISGMRERLRQLGGDLTITRAEPGTLVEARVAIFGEDFDSNSDS